MKIIQKNNEIFNDSFFSLKIHRDFTFNKIFYFNFFEFNLQPFDINLEGTILSKLINLIICLNDNITNIKQSYNDSTFNYCYNVDSPDDCLQYNINKNIKNNQLNKKNTNLKFNNSWKKKNNNDTNTNNTEITTKNCNKKTKYFYIDDFIKASMNKAAPLKLKKLESDHNIKLYLDEFILSKIKFNLTFNPTVNKVRIYFNL